MNKCEDSGLVINFPDENYTKIDENKYFENFSSLFKNFKVMDCAWLENENNTLWLIELKNYYNPDNEQYTTTNISEEKKKKNRPFTKNSWHTTTFKRKT